jgi:RsiW-degrading membrane proteinase PrsW (M82 family)
MAEDWFYLKENNESFGPVSLESIRSLITAGKITGRTLLWNSSLPEWTTAAALGLAPALPPPPPGHPSSGAQKPVQLLRNIGAKISELTDLPEITDVPVMKILFERAFSKAPRNIEDDLIVGTIRTTPDPEQLEDGWPHARICWRVLAGALATYFLLQFGWTQFHNPNRIPAMMFVGSFIVPLTVVIFFFEMNTPRNISVYQITKMLVLGGALSIITNAVLGQIIPGAGTGQLIPSLLTGALEETAKALALLLIITNRRYPWQINGLLFGAAVGAGFAGFESAGYAFKPIWQNPGMPLDNLVAIIQDNLTIRGLLAPGGHVIWTAIVASAIWKAKGDGPFSLSTLAELVVLRRWLTAVILHAIWDSDLAVSFLGRLISEQACSIGQAIVLCVVGWYIVFAILKQALSEVALVRTGVKSGKFKFELRLQ